MKNFFQQLGFLWNRLGLNQRISLVLATLGVIGGMATLVIWSGRPQMQLLYGRLGEKDISEVIASLQEQGVKYEVGAGGGSVFVPSDLVYKLRMQLASKGVPAGEGVGFEVFDRANFGISDFVQRTNFVRALQGELSRTISQLQGVRHARVLIVMPENRLLFTEAKAKPTASVFIEGQLGSEAVNSIRFLVANAVEGLRADDVAVVDNRGNSLTESLRDDPQLGTASSQMKLRKSVEDYLASKTETMLSKVLGAGAAVVRVSADLETENSTRMEERFDPDGQVIRTETSTDDSTITNEKEAGPADVGVTANTPAATANPAAQKGIGKTSEQSKKNKTQAYEINRVVLNATKAPGSIARVTAAVFVASRAQPRTPAEIDALRSMVGNALGIKAEGKELARVVTLQEVAFETVPVEKANMLDMAMGNTELIKHGLTVAAALLLFFMFFRMLTRVKPDAIPVELLDPQHVHQLEGGRGPVTVEMLNEMIRQKPGNVGAALRDWMSNNESRS